ncbi:AEC family transporter [Phaeobacter gallaeciensis]|uniref:AEC family transporter n=1 Tax=Phaeobacter gallaeciensis TaxID=60890 RepID=UPI00237F2CD6|nr:AEC family transporter [Phaeobacter gallaeciensis]MDE4304916.1 AEC family transporter [Phaeobacter gallaeciensis]MDE4309264.1 AEC family transporter [Phaeobacter gallaeciensis]MDE4313721.1 AEC family transporter [Phaeobacter gallaeciensis]MDE4318301.1 AEC family transporter [Phaeobacter gallaeciensis]MDE4323207.1 AEC family transporter [Phaeobacter gallaeciensis]
MNLALTVLEIVAPVFLLAGVGFAWVRFGFEYRIQFVTRLAMTLAVPCLIFTALMKTELDKAAIGWFVLAALAGHALLALAGAALVRVMQLERRSYLAPFIFGNTGNLGIPLSLFAFGEAGLGYAVAMLAVSAVLSFTFGIYLVAGEGGGGKALREPMVWATLLGALFLWQGWHTPQILTNALDLIGQMAIPLMLITLGVAVARLTPGKTGLAVLLSLIKVTLSAAIGWGLGLAFGLDYTAFGVLVLQLATPVAVTSYLLAEKFEADAQAVAGMVVVSTLMSVAALPLLLSLLLEM